MDWQMNGNTPLPHHSITPLSAHGWLVMRDHSVSCVAA